MRGNEWGGKKEETSIAEFVKVGFSGILGFKMSVGVPWTSVIKGFIFTGLVTLNRL